MLPEVNVLVTKHVMLTLCCCDVCLRTCRPRPARNSALRGRYGSVFTTDSGGHSGGEDSSNVMRRISANQPLPAGVTGADDSQLMTSERRARQQRIIEHQRIASSFDLMSS